MDNYGAKIAKALVAFKKELSNVSKDSNNPFFGSTYASLPHINEVIAPVLAKHGLTYIQGQGICVQDKVMRIKTTILHDSGECLVEYFDVALDKPTPQGSLATATYGRRGALEGAFGLAASDDDGNTAEKEAVKAPKKAPAKPKAKPKPKPKAKKEVPFPGRS